MDTTLLRARREFYTNPNIEALERYAIETIRSGSEPAGHSLMYVMQRLETQRRRDTGMTGPDVVALWFEEHDEADHDTYCGSDTPDSCNLSHGLQGWKYTCEAGDKYILS